MPILVSSAASASLSLRRSGFFYVCAMVCALVAPRHVVGQSLSSLTEADIAYGERLYQGRCARCHGLAGLGGEGPSLARPYFNYARDDEALVSVVRNGIPGTGMPGGGWVSDLEARQVAAYVRTLGRVTVATAPKGDPVRGELLYRTKGECGACHGPNGIGNRFGPSLTDVGGRRSADFIRQSIVDPGAALPQGLNGVLSVGFREYLPVRAREPNEAAVFGQRINESSFTILVRDEDGELHSFQKNELAELTKQFGRSLMPSYQRRLTNDEVDDVVAYLIGLRDVIP